MSSQREAMVETLWLRDGQHRDHREAQADAVIQYLWQRADDPEVVEAVQQAYLDGLAKRHLNESGAFYSILIGEAVAETIPELLTALLGPRPNGGEATNER